MCRHVMIMTNKVHFVALFRFAKMIRVRFRLRCLGHNWFSGVCSALRHSEVRAFDETDGDSGLGVTVGNRIESLISWCGCPRITLLLLGGVWTHVE